MQPASGEILIVEGEIGEDNFNGGVKLTTTALYTIAEARARLSQHVLLSVTPSDVEHFGALRALLEQYPGPCAVQLDYVNGQAKKRVSLDARWGVLPDDHLLDALVQLLEPTRVQVCY